MLGGGIEDVRRSGRAFLVTGRACWRHCTYREGNLPATMPTRQPSSRSGRNPPSARGAKRRKKASPPIQTPPPESQPAARRCGCGATFDDLRWSSLRLLDRVASTEVQLFNPGWADGHCIEIRECDECAHGVLSKTVAVRAQTKASA
jgi:hypothetical protein